MPLAPLKSWRNLTSADLAEAGTKRAQRFCELNKLPIPSFRIVEAHNWFVDACAFYRPDTITNRQRKLEGIHICLNRCARTCHDNDIRNWNWPGSSVDREPYGVLCHELGHHADWVKGKAKYKYSSDYGDSIMKQANESPLTNYCPNPAEWFAEMFRLFVTNPDLLRLIKPKTYSLLRKDWKPLPHLDWRDELGNDVPYRVIASLRNKFSKAVSLYK